MAAAGEDVEAKAEHLRLQLSSVDLNSDQNLDTISEERDVFYDDGGLALDNIGFDSVVFVDNLPVVGEEEVQKLESDIREIFGGVGVIKKDGFSMPLNPRTLETSGHCYIEFNTRQEAELAMESINGYKYKKSILSVTLYDDIHSFVDVSPEQTALEFESSIAENREEDESDNSSGEEEEDENEDDSVIDDGDGDDDYWVRGTYPEEEMER